jgi:hypothetical protein
MFNSFLDKIKSQLGSDVNKDSDKFEYKPFEYKPFEYKPWEKTSDVLAAEDKKGKADSAYNTFVNNGFGFSKEQDYTDAYNAWMGREDFSYDFNKDALYQQYKDKYIKQGKMAMADTMGQASAMTGGYGNSYAATAGNQAYQASLENLNDVIPELYQMAYDRYNQKGQDMLNTLSLLGNERNYERGIYESDLSRLANDRSYYATEADNVFARDYGIWNDQRTYDRGVYDSDRTLAHGEHTNSENARYNEHRNAIEDAQWQATMDENQRQFNESMAFSKKQYNESRQAAQNNTGSTVDISDIKKKAATFTDNEQLRDYLNGMANSKFIDSTTAIDLYDLYATPEQVALDKRDWALVSRGGFNFGGGINNNTKMKDQYNNEYSMKKLNKELIESGMSEKDAYNYIVALQKKHDIGSWWGA